MNYACDVLVIGAGAAGSVAALNLALKGHSVLVVEKLSRLGGHNQAKIDTKGTGTGSVDFLFLGEVNG